MEIKFPAGSLNGLPMYQAACRIVKTLRQAGFTAWLVGGAVRDMVLGKSPKDFDITTSAIPDEITKLFPKSIPVGASFGVITVVEDGMNFEVATYREERDYEDGRRPENIRFSKTPQEDVSRRDFTVNALLYDPEREVILDLTGGISDLKRGVLRTVGDAYTRFSEDYLRMLRAVRFAVRLDLELDPSAEDAVRQLAPKLSFLSAERVRDELDKMLTGRHPDRAFRLMSRIGILKVILPEVERMHHVEQPPQYHPEGDVFEHTMLLLSHIAVPDSEIGWSALLHDVGKPETFRVIGDRIRFFSHETKGAELAEKIMLRLKLPARTIRNVVQAIAGHMRFSFVNVMRPAKWRRYLADPNFPLELELHRLDCISCHGKLDNYVIMLDRIRTLKESGAVPMPKPLITGTDLIALGMKPSPALGKILQKIADLQLEGNLSTRAEALAEAEKILAGEP